MASNALQDLGVLVTRPTAQAEPLCNLIEQHGGTAYRAPVLVIRDIDDTAELDQALATINEIDMAIFVSVNAVERGWQHLQRCRQGIPEHAAIACIGPTSADAVTQQGSKVDIVPSDRFDSEGLLALPAMQQVENKKIIIFRGQGGRPTLGETLQQRGARVSYAECYNRGIPDIDNGPILEHLRHGNIQVITVSSTEGLLNLIQMMGPEGADLLKQIPLVAPSQRVADVAASKGFRHEAIVAANAGDRAMVDAIIRRHQP